MKAKPQASSIALTGNADADAILTLLRDHLARQRDPIQPGTPIVVNITVPPGHPIMPDGSPAPTFLTEDEFCKLVRCKKRTLQEYRKRRLARGFMNGRRVMFELSEATAFVHRLKAATPA